MILQSVAILQSADKCYHLSSPGAPTYPKSNPLSPVITLMWGPQNSCKIASVGIFNKVCYLCFLPVGSFHTIAAFPVQNSSI